VDREGGPNPKPNLQWTSLQLIGDDDDDNGKCSENGATTLPRMNFSG